MRYLVATASGLVLCACGLFIGNRLGVLDTLLFPPCLLSICAAVVIAVSKPWFSSDGRARPLGRLTVAWLAAIGCLILVVVIGGVAGFLYTCSRVSCMP
jgi:hypothetical protein